jgi:hypothetical protein
LAALITLFIGGQASAASIDTVFGVNDYQIVALDYDDDDEDYEDNDDNDDDEEEYEDDED